MSSPMSRTRGSAARAPVLAASVARPTLDDVYLHHTGRTLTDAQHTGEEVAA